jgi:hypothetical protein
VLESKGDADVQPSLVMLLLLTLRGWSAAGRVVRVRDEWSEKRESAR